LYREMDEELISKTHDVSSTTTWECRSQWTEWFIDSHVRMWCSTYKLICGLAHILYSIYVCVRTRVWRTCISASKIVIHYLLWSSCPKMYKSENYVVWTLFTLHQMVEKLTFFNNKIDAIVDQCLNELQTTWFLICIRLRTWRL